MTPADSERLVRIETQVDVLVRDLMGNGQPGKIEIHSRRIGQLERWRSYVNGSLVVIAFVLSATVTVGGILLAAVLRK